MSNVGGEMKRTVYLAGRITGDPYYFSKFYEAEKALTADGFIVLSPAILPPSGFEWEQYMHVSGAMLDICTSACFLPDWNESRGARLEHDRAIAQGKDVFYFDEWIQGRTTKPTTMEKTEVNDIA